MEGKGFLSFFLLPYMYLFKKLGIVLFLNLYLQEDVSDKVAWTEILARSIFDPLWELKIWNQIDLQNYLTEKIEKDTTYTCFSICNIEFFELLW